MSETLGPEARRLLDALQLAESPTTHELARVRALMFCESSPPPERGSKSLRAAAKKLVLLFGIVLLTAPAPAPAAANTPSLERAPRVGVAAIAVSPPRVAPTAIEARIEPLTVAASTPAIATPRRRAHHPSASRRRVESNDATRTDDASADEAKLVRAARQALRDGDPALALRRAEEHASQFPTGVLALERSLVHARALCALGRTANARRVAEAVLRERPHSHLGAQLRSVCVDDSGTEREPPRHGPT